MDKSLKTARQVAGTMAMEGMKLNEKEFLLIRQCASGKKSSQAIINDLIKKYKANN
jgi:hypothetical protein